MYNCIIVLFKLQTCSVVVTAFRIEKTNTEMEALLQLRKQSSLRPTGSRVCCTYIFQTMGKQLHMGPSAAEFRVKSKEL